MSSIEIYICYASGDEPLLRKLEVYLRAYKRQGFFNVWYDRNILAGDEWAKEIDKHLSSAQIILLLVSPDFLASDFCYLDQMERALERHELSEAHVIPVIL